MMIVKFGPNYSLTYGYYQCPVCGREWYGPHMSYVADCLADAIYIFGPNEQKALTPIELRDQVSQILSKEVIAKST